ncbi:MAG: hypothetical protein KDE08_10755 [Rhodobacteraceae bacterium]|nr:hypothetical protein [Paracoccaceae bacterium]
MQAGGQQTKRPARGALAAAALAFASAFAVLPARAQSPDLEAAKLLRLGIETCAINYDAPQKIFAAFTQAGFFYSKEDFGGGPDDVIHWFNRPDRLVDFAFLLTEHGAECRISTQHMAVPMALKFTGIALRSLFGAEVADGSPEGDNIVPGLTEALSNECSGYSFIAPGRAIWVTLGTAGQDPTCTNDGTSQIRMRM